VLARFQPDLLGEGLSIHKARAGEAGSSSRAECWQECTSPRRGSCCRRWVSRRGGGRRLHSGSLVRLYEGSKKPA